jgi:arginine/serine-rich splicing factor 4/5/6
MDGQRLRVEITKRGPRGEKLSDRGGSYRDDRGRPSRQYGTSYRVTVSGLADSVSWQDLKDFLRAAGEVAHADVDRRGRGTASFHNADDMDRAIRKLDDQELNGERVRIREVHPTGSIIIIEH